MLPLEDRELLSQTMVGLNIDAETISSLLFSFDKAASGLENDPVAPVVGASYGDSFTGGYRLATNVEMAHQAVGEELQRMVAGLREMGASVEEFSNDVQKTTEQSVATATRIEVATDCVAAPDFASSQCTLPTESQD
ncbi:hypothetical protein F4692_002366 [Nocardioides cavernae]|uniref:Uncharacterized protein n=1 Tax=Nocardioides cavernae TaxID=1921566 RepID=A0A7Y9H403_9ACTN|nr:hypothetical protein [Nocardioides cavernae]NYE37233.1 hypothetical protein [Nocardioides cavernae]